jgi:uncharacterized protein
MSISFSLYQLQKIDSQIMESEKRLSSIIVEMQGNPEIMQAKKDLEDWQSKNDTVAATIDGINQSIIQKRIKIEQSEASLYGGKEQNPKILQDLQKEIGILKVQLNDLNDKLFEKMIEMEKVEHELLDKNNFYKQVEIRFNSLKSLLTSEQGNLTQRINRLKIERQTAITQIPAAYSQEYEKLKAGKQGLAIASLQDNSCSACGTTFTPSQCQSSRSQTELFYCPTCHRIIYGE